VLLLAAGAVAQVGSSTPNTSTAPNTEHIVYLPHTDHELHVYRIFGREPGNTVIIIGGIHGNEPGGYLAADKYVDLNLRRGNLIVVPRANLLSILSNDRGVGGDYNRRFDSPLSADSNDDQVIMVLQQLIEESDVLLNLHDGSGFYRDTYIDRLHNPYRFGQSIIVDCESYRSERSGEVILLGEIARSVVSRVNEQIENASYHFHFSNHDSLAADTRYPEMRRTATYFALTRFGIPAFGIETSKLLPSTEMKVAHQLLAINAILDEFGIEVDVPGLRVDPPRFDYAVVSVNDREDLVVRDGGTLRVRESDTVRIDHIVGNYERHMYADFQGIGGRNDNGRQVPVTRPLRVRVRKDADICGGFQIVPRPETEAPARVAGTPSSANFIIEVNGHRELVPGGGELEVIRGDLLRVLDYLAPGLPAGINVNFLGYVSNPQNNRGEDRGSLIYTADDLLVNWSVDGRGERYAIAVKLGSRELTRMTVRLLEPQLDYVVVRRNQDRPVVLQAGERWHLHVGDRLTVLGAATSAPDERSLSYRLCNADGRELQLRESSFVAGRGGPGSALTLSVLRGEQTMGSVTFLLTEAADGAIGRGRR